jgi:cytochrome b subunit of formate dehydrogenase
MPPLDVPDRSDSTSATETAARLLSKPMGDRATVERFDVVERSLHWANAVLVLILLGTGASLYFGPLSEIVGRRTLVKEIHVWAGLLLPVPFVLALPGPWGGALRRDLGRLNRWGDAKFNRGQQLNAAFVGGALVLMFVTGLMLRWPDSFRDDLRTGATFVHDWMFIGLGVSVVGHIWLAISYRETLRGMWRGRVSAEWARRQRPGWLPDVDESSTSRTRS